MHVLMVVCMIKWDIIQLILLHWQHILRLLLILMRFDQVLLHLNLPIVLYRLGFINVDIMMSK